MMMWQPLKTRPQLMAWSRLMPWPGLAKLRPKTSQGVDEGGSGTMVAAAVGLLACLVAAGVLLAGAVLVQARGLGGTADLVALSAATARAADEDPCGAAERVAAANNAVVKECTAAGDILDFAVTVVVGRAAELPLGGLEYELSASASAGWMSVPP